MVIDFTIRTKGNYILSREVRKKPEDDAVVTSIKTDQLESIKTSTEAIQQHTDNPTTMTPQSTIIAFDEAMHIMHAVVVMNTAVMQTGML